MPTAISISIRNRQRLRRIDSRFLREVIHSALCDLGVLPGSEICFHLVAAPEMARINRQFLQHEGSTDVITFDHSESPGRELNGEIFICVLDAIAQAKEFKTIWQAEVVRYAVHGVLHLLGHDDLKPAVRRVMKRTENRQLLRLAKEFPLRRLAR